MCFSCGRQGHGVNRCSQMNTSFPFLPPGWSVDVRNGQYRATRTERTGLGSPPGNEGWSGREGQPPGPSGIKALLTLVGEGEDVRPLSSCRWGAGWDLTGPQTPRPFRHWEASLRRIVDGMIESVWTALKGCWGVGANLCRYLQSRWMEAPGRWFPRGPKLEGMGGGCGRPEGVGHVFLG